MRPSFRKGLEIMAAILFDLLKMLPAPYTIYKYRRRDFASLKAYISPSKVCLNDLHIIWTCQSFLTSSNRFLFSDKQTKQDSFLWGE